MRRYIDTIENSLDPINLVETRQALLFHGAPLEKVFRIMAENRLSPFTTHMIDGREYEGVSLSRNAKVSQRYGSAIFVIDQQKLRLRHKLVPVNFYSKHKSRGAEKFDCQSPHYEAEEFLIGPLERLMDYVLKIVVQSQIYRMLDGRFEDGSLSEPGVRTGSPTNSSSATARRLRITISCSIRRTSVRSMRRSTRPCSSRPG